MEKKEKQNGKKPTLGVLVAQLVQHVRSVDAGVVAQLLRNDLEKGRIIRN